MRYGLRHGLSGKEIDASLESGDTAPVLLEIKELHEDRQELWKLWCKESGTSDTLRGMLAKTQAELRKVNAKLLASSS